MNLLGENLHITVHKDNEIIVLTFLNDLNITLDVAQKMTASRKQMTLQYPSYPAIVNVNNTNSITSEARNYFRSQEALEKFEAIAVISNNSVSNFLFNVFIKAWNPPLPIKKFDNYESAKTWLRSLN